MLFTNVVHNNTYMIGRLAVLLIVLLSDHSTLPFQDVWTQTQAETVRAGLVMDTVGLIGMSARTARKAAASVHAG